MARPPTGAPARGEAGGGLLLPAPEGAVLVVGPGAVGGVLAARWASTGRDVLLLGRSEAAEAAISRRGLLFREGSSPQRRIRRHLLSARREGRGRRPEAIFLCVKSYDAASAAEAALPWAGPKTPVVALQNGLGHEKLLRRAFGPARAVLGSCYAAADRPAPGACAATGGRRILLAADKANRESALKARRLLREAGWAVGLVPSRDRLLWTKLCLNAATNLLGALCAVPNGRLASDPPLREIMLGVLGEAVAIASKAGFAPLYADMASLLLRSCRGCPEQRNSMLQDLQAGRRTELAAIAGPLLAAARSHGIKAPLLSRLAALLRRLERALSDAGRGKGAR